MNVHERRRYEMLVRVRDFGDSYGHLFQTVGVARQNFEAVASAVKELDALEIAHMAASVSARADRKTMARDALLARLQAIDQTARVLAEDTPGLDRQFRVPGSASDHTLLTTGRKFARDVEPFASRFIAHGMPATFAADLNTLVDAFDRAVCDRGVGREARRAARERTKAALASGLAAVRSLNAIVTNHLRDDEVTSTLWKRQRRVVYRWRAKPADATPEPAPLAAETGSPTGTKAA